jgi:hypothetical protein
MPAGIVIQITGEGAGAAEALRIIEERMKQTQARGVEMSEALAAAGERIRGMFEMAGIGLGFAEVISQMREAVKAAGEFGEAISKAAEKTGIAAGTLSVMHYAADVTGTDFDRLVNGISRMGKNMGDAVDGNKKLAAAFQNAGIDAAALVGRSDGLEIALGKLGQKLIHTEGAGRRNQLMMTLLSKAGADAIPAITELAMNFDHLKEKTIDAGRYLDALAAEKLKLLNQALKDMHERIGGAQVAFAQGLMPALTGVFQAFSDATKGANLFQEVGKQTGLAVIEVAAVFEKLWYHIRQTKNEYTSWTQTINALDYAAGANLNWTQAMKDEAARKRDIAQKAVADARADHDAAIQEDERFIASLKKIKQDIESGKTANLGSGDHGGGDDGGGYNGTGGDGISKLDRDFWLSNPHSVIEAIRQQEREISAAGVLAQKEAMEAARKQLYPDHPDNMSVFDQPAPDVHLEHDYEEMPGAPASQYQDDKLEEKTRNAREAARTIGGFMDQIAESAAHGRLTFKSFVDSAISDLARWAIKIMEEKALIPALNSLFGISSGPNFNSAGYATTDSGMSYGAMLNGYASGGDPSPGEMAVVGEKGPELAFFGSGGHVVANDVVKSMATAGHGGAPNVMINNVNNSSQPVEMKQSGVTFDHEARQFIIHTVLEDMASGGPLAAARG